MPVSICVIYFSLWNIVYDIDKVVIYNIQSCAIDKNVPFTDFYGHNDLWQIFPSVQYMFYIDNL